MERAESIALIHKAAARVAPDRVPAIEALELNATLAQLGIDSAGSVEMVGLLEEEMGVVFDDLALARLETLGDLVALVRASAARSGAERPTSGR